MTAAATPLSHHITVTNGAVNQTLFMSFGLLNRLTRLLGDVDRLPLLSIDPELQETMLVEVFTERDKRGLATSVPSLDEIEVSLEEVNLVLDFVGDHITSFFMEAAEKAQARAGRVHKAMAEAQARMSVLMPTKPGSSNSPLTKAAA